MRERFLSMVGSFFNDSFQLADQYVVQYISRHNEESFYIQRDILAALVAKHIREENQLYPLLQKGPGMIDSFLQFYTWLKDHDDTSLLAQIGQTEDSLLKAFATLYQIIDESIERMNLYTVEDAYNRFILLYEHNSGKPPDILYDFLFLDGFFDLTPKVRRFFYHFFGSFKTVYLSVPLNPDGSLMDASFEKFEKSDHPQVDNYDWRTEVLQRDGNVPDSFLKTVINAVEAKTPPESIFRSNIRSIPFLIREFANPQHEAMTVCNWIKQVLKEKRCIPEDIGIVIRDEKKYVSLIQEGFSENGVPYRYEGELPLNRSLNVNKLLLPFRAYSTGFSPDIMFALVETGFVDTNILLPFPEFESIAMRAKLAYSQAFFDKRPVSFGIRKKDWTERISKYTRLLQRKISETVSLEDDEEIHRMTEKELESLKIVSEILNQLFKRLSFFTKAQKPKANEGYLEYFKSILEVYRKNGSLSEAEEEQNALSVFFEELLPKLNRFIYTIDNTDKKDKCISYRDYWKYLKIFVDHTTYRQSVRIDNRVYLSNLENARFREKKIKIFVGMTDQNYPLLSFSSVFMRTQWPKENDGISTDSFRDYIVQKEHRDFINAVRTTDSFVLFTYPKADISGNIHIPSTFLNPFSSWVERADSTGSPVKPSVQVTVGDAALYSLRQFAVDLISRKTWLSPEVRDTLSKAGIVFPEILRKEENDAPTSEDSQRKKTIAYLFGDTFSASKYTTLQDCHRKYFFRYLLKLYRPIQIVQGFDFLTEGVIFHQTMKSVFETVKTQGAFSDADSFIKSLHVSLEKEITKRMYDPAKLLEEVEVEFFSSTLSRFFSTYDKRIYTVTEKIKKSYPNLVEFHPDKFEVPFKKETKLIFHKKPDGTPIYLIGKIDRIDRFSDDSIVVFDYKRTIHKEGIDQLLLYTWALEKIDTRKVRAISLLEMIPKESGVKTLVSNPDKLSVFFDPQRKNVKEKERDKVVEEAKHEIDRILQGNFSKSYKNCFQCEFLSLCRLFADVGNPQDDYSEVEV
jgi:ATP-dependent helicase/nuclease subunit B